MSVRKVTHGYLVPELQAAAALTQAAPVQNTWYTILDTTKNVVLELITAKVETANETLEVRLTLDGNSYTGSQAATAGTLYYIYVRDIVGNLGLATFDTSLRLPCSQQALLSVRSAKIELRKTTATGAGDLKGTVQYAKW